MSLIQEARDVIIKDKQARDKASQEREKLTIDKEQADVLFRGIYEDGIVVIEQYSEPVTATKSLVGHLSGFFRRINPFGSRYKYGRGVFIAVEEEEPQIGIRLDERVVVGRQIQQLQISLDGIEEQLITGIDKKGQHSWDILAPDRYQYWKNVIQHGRHWENPLEDAQKWRGLMDTVLALRPIDRIVRGESVTQTPSSFPNLEGQRSSPG